MLLTEKTKQQLTDNKIKKSNIFGLGLTSLIAACSSAADSDDKGNKAGPVGTRPTENLVPAELRGNNDYSSSGFGNGSVTFGINQGSFDLLEKDIKFAFASNKPTVNYYYSVTQLDNMDKINLVVSSNTFDDNAGAVYIFWDVTNITPPATASLVADTIALNHLKIAGTASDNILHNKDYHNTYAPKFYKNLGGDKDQVDMIFYSSPASNNININIVWDATKYSETATITTLTIDSSPGILQIKPVATTKVDTESYEFRKINNNDDYDILIKDKVLDSSSGSPIYILKDTYILWDVTKYSDATEHVSIALTADSATNGLLKITGLTENIMRSGDGYTDINKGGINDLAFKYNGNIFVLFGEKIAIRDDEGKAFSYEVDLATINTANTFYTNDTEVTADSDAEKEGFFSYDFDGDGGSEAVEKVGYRFAASARAASDDSALDNLAKVETAYTDANPHPAPEDALSSDAEVTAYWDIA